MRTLWNDLRYATRQLRKSPGFTVAAVLTLALGIGAAAAMFSVLDAVLLRPLPYRDARRIVQIQTRADAGYTQPASWPGYLDMRRLDHNFSAVTGVDYSGATLTEGHRAIYLRVVRGTDNFFQLYGVRPLLGRAYLPGEDRNGRNNVAVLSYGVWQQYFGGRKNIVGQTVHLNGSLYTVIGVMPAGFRVRFDAPNVIYTPLHLSADQIKSRGSHWLRTFGRMKPGVNLAQAQADMAHVMNLIGQQFPETDQGRTATIIPLMDVLHTNQSGNSDLPELWVLLAAVFAVLLIACTNVAGLTAIGIFGLLSQEVSSRTRDIGVRMALGETRGGVARLVLRRVGILLAIGVGAGLIGVLLIRRVLTAVLVIQFHRDGWIIAAIAVGLGLVGLASALLPARRAASIDPLRALRSE